MEALGLDPADFNRFDIRADIETADISPGLVLVDIAPVGQIYIRFDGVAAGFALPDGTHLLAVVPESLGDWIDKVQRDGEPWSQFHARQTLEAAVKLGAAEPRRRSTPVPVGDVDEEPEIPF